jgi:hypothetical protein
VASLDQSSAKGPLSYILRYFPAGIDPLDNAPTDEGALTGLARWLIRWHVKANEVTHTPHYTLPGKMRERLSKAPNAGQFLQACELLHDSLTERLAIEPTARQLLGVAFSPENWQAVRDALKWWAGWIRAQSELAPLVRTGAGVYLEALERIPIAIREVGNIPQYVVTTSSDFDKEMRPLWEGFRVAIRALGFGEQQSLRNQLNGLRGIDREKLKRQREQFEQNEQYAYPLEWLHDEYQPFRFEIADHPDGFQDGRPVGATFWADLSVLVWLKQQAAQLALTVLNADSHGAVPLPAPASNATTEPDLTDYLADRCPLDLCDKAAKKIGLSVGSGADTFSDLRIHALAEALKETYSLRAKKGIISQVRLDLAQRYGIKNYNSRYSPQHSKAKNGRNAQWDSFYLLAENILKSPYNL